jgi:predicted ArsR family transcriptional regulator
MSSSVAREDRRNSPAVLSVLGSKYGAELLCAAETPKSAQKLSEELAIPIATCYRRIDDLVDAGLLVCEGRRFSPEGRRTNVYRRTLNELEVDFCADGPTFSETRRTAARNQLQDTAERERPAR